MGGRQRRTAVTALLLLSLAPGTGPAATWDVVPEVTVRGTYNDNPNLTIDGTERGDFIVQVAPGLRIEARGARLHARMSLRPTAYFYSRSSTADESRTQLEGFARMEAIERFFFVEANASVAETFVSPFAPRPTDPTALTANRAESRTLGLSPYLRGRFLGEHSYELRNRYLWTTTDNQALRDARAIQWSARLASPVRRFGWALDYDESRTHYEQSLNPYDLETRLARSSFYFQPSPEYRLSASVGRDQNNYAGGETRSSRTRGAGFTWNPGPRTSADLQYERRFFGPTRLARLQHRTRLTAWNISYSRNISEFQRELLRVTPGDTAALLDAIFAARFPDPLERQAAVEEFMRANGIPASIGVPTSFYTQQVFLQERAEMSAAILGVRNSITFTLFASKSDSLTQELDATTPDAFLAAQGFRQHGLSVRADHRLTPFTSVAASVTRSFARQEEPSLSETRNDFVSASLNHTLSRATTAAAGVSLTEFEDQGLGTPARRARSAFVGLTHRF